MSAPGAPDASAGWAWLPPPLRPLEQDPGGVRERAGTRLVEVVLLVLVGLLLGVATVNDLARETRINHRLVADLRTWREYTHRDYRNISIDQQTLGLASGREVLCGNTSPGPPGSRPQLCLAIWGPVRDGRRTVHGGWYLPPYQPDIPARRYGCFGAAGRGKCPG